MGACIISWVYMYRYGVSWQHKGGGGGPREGACTVQYIPPTYVYVHVCVMYMLLVFIYLQYIYIGQVSKNGRR